MLFRFCLYGFLKNQRYFEPFLMLIFLDQNISFFQIGLLIAVKELTVNLLEIPSGAIADSTGRRGAMMLSFTAYIISFLVFAMSSSVWLYAFAMFLYGIGDTFRTGTHKAMIFEWLRLNDRTDEKTHVYGITRSWSQIGSAISGIIAAAFVFVSGDYRYVFWFAIIPYLINLINFAGYPKSLDGAHAKSTSPERVWQRVTSTMRRAIVEPPIRRLMLETMTWEGYLAAIKDYLQPVLQVLAITLFGYWFGTAGYYAIIDEATPHMLPETQPVWFSDTRRVAIVIGLVYSMIFFLSAWASRNAERFRNRFGGSKPASVKLWMIQLLLFAALATLAWFGISSGMIALFVCLIVLKNLWRPILISRFDDLSSAEEGATMLSIESQARHGSTLVFAPLIGLMVDGCSGELWAIGLFGLILSAGMLIPAKSGKEVPAEEVSRSSTD
ncbi:MAG: MFS transporter [Planctomycetota bacterium]